MKRQDVTQSSFPDHALPTVVIVGRPNVGKSTLFNRLVGRKLALVDDQPGVTRDRREAQAQLFDLEFRLVDTAGLEEEAPESLSGRMRAQTQRALAEGDLALLVIDARVGVTPADRHFAQWLRRQDVPAIVIANKAEGRAGEAGVIEAWDLGLGDPTPLSAEHGEGLADLFAAMCPFLDEKKPDATGETQSTDEDSLPDDAILKLAIIGRPNAGKSTLINRMIGQDRLVTGPEAGITRDSIAINWSWQGRDVRLIDTAGVRKRARVQEKLEKLSVADTRRAIDFCEVAVLLLDSRLGLEAQDLRIADLVLQEGRALMIALSKWDAAEDRQSLFQGVNNALKDGLSQLGKPIVVTVSGHTGAGIDAMLQAAFSLRSAWSRRVQTSRLNQWLEAALTRNPPPAPDGRRIKLRYVTQARVRPPTFIVFGNRLDMLPASYRRYLLNSLRTDLGFESLPVRLELRSRTNPFDTNDKG